MEVGVGLWSMQQHNPVWRSLDAQYAELRREARLCEGLGIDSLWISEHHGWYDGYCPAALLAAASALGETTRLRVGTGIMVVPLYEPVRLARETAQLHELSGERLVLGVGAGYREAEFALFGVHFATRGRALAERLATMQATWDSGIRPELWVGAGVPAAVRRAARLGAGVLLPPAFSARRVRELAELYREAGGRRVGLIRDVWLDETDARARRVSEPWLTYCHAQYAGMAGLGGEQVRGATERALASALCGTSATVLEQLAWVVDLGLDLLIFRVRYAAQDPVEVERCLRLVAGEVRPALEGRPA
jgi:alkanesulfonate monooxygenase SsuD/methylene tetrahydromethanopterin reductase-like flavin-dependent oxidoreductase (luciferase family)